MSKFGITINYYEESNGAEYNYEGYREYKDPYGCAAAKWIAQLKNHFTIRRIVIRDNKGNKMLERSFEKLTLY